jgi:hypothetical protein
MGIRDGSLGRRGWNLGIYRTGSAIRLRYSVCELKPFPCTLEKSTYTSCYFYSVLFPCSLVVPDCLKENPTRVASIGPPTVDMSGLEIRESKRALGRLDVREGQSSLLNPCFLQDDQ